MQRFAFNLYESSAKQPSVRDNSTSQFLEADWVGFITPLGVSLCHCHRSSSLSQSAASIIFNFPKKKPNPETVVSGQSHRSPSTKKKSSDDETVVSWLHLFFFSSVIFQCCEHHKENSGASRNTRRISLKNLQNTSRGKARMCVII